MERKRANRDAGFGIILLLLVILGVSLSASVVFVNASLSSDQHRISVTQAKLRRIALAISTTNLGEAGRVGRSYEDDVGALPTALSGLLTKPAPVSACAYDATTQALGGWCGPYFNVSFTTESAFVDAWGRTITYDSAGRRVYSFGANGTDNSGGSDDLVQTF